METGNESTEKVVPETDEAPAGDSDDDSASLEADSADSSDDDSDDDDAEDSGDDSSGAKDLFLAGDKAGALKALGLDPKILDVSDAKFRTMRQGLKAADTALAAATAKEAAGLAAEAKAAELYEQGKKELGPVLQLRRMLAKGDYMSAKDLLEALAPPGTTYQQIAEGIALAAKGMSPSEQLYRRRLRELDEREQKEKDEKVKPPEKTVSTDTGRNLEGAKKMLAGTALADVAGAAEALVRVAAENWDAEKRGFRVPRAKLVELVSKDPVISQLLELKTLKAKTKTKAAEVKEIVREEKTGRFRERPRAESKLTPEQQAQARRDAEFKASVAEAAAMERRERVRAGAGKGRR